ncbi:MAG: BrnT family toxin [Desulfovibrionales bacterium]|nr:BrnT family toxin [Desulfovibrionales bacterium]
MMITPGTTIEFNEEKNETNFEDHHFCLGCLGDIVESMLYGRIPVIFSEEFWGNNEARFMVLAEYQGLVVLAACTMRNEGQTIRVMSFRPAHRNERETFYEELEKLVD